MPCGIKKKKKSYQVIWEPSTNSHQVWNFNYDTVQSETEWGQRAV